jgi:predicted Fe-S protein YdhL (DUF1289 family)
MTDAAASELAKKRWKKTSPEERSQVGRDLAKAKYANMSDQDRAAIGRRLAKARRKAAKKRSA